MVKSGDIKVSASQLGILALALEDLMGIQAKANLRLSPGNQPQGLLNSVKVEPTHAAEEAGKALDISHGTVMLPRRFRTNTFVE